MEQSQLGIDPKTRRHVRTLTLFESKFLGILWVDQVGRENAIPADEFAIRLAAALGTSISDRKEHEEWKRDVRALQNHLLIEHNVPVYSAAGPGGGYWIGESRGEGDAFYETFRKRGLTGMVKASRGRKSALVDMVTQLSFQFEDLVVQAGMRPKAADDAVAAPVEIVDAFLQRMLKDPDKFSEGLRVLGEKYGSVLVPRKRFNEIVGALKSQAASLSDLVTSLEN